MSCGICSPGALIKVFFLLMVTAWIYLTISIVFFEDRSGLSGNAEQALDKRFVTSVVRNIRGGKSDNTNDATIMGGTKVFDSTYQFSSVSSTSVLHIVNTRFMQGQGHLTHLANARLELFRTFCLPTMLKQNTTISPVLWIIKIDPELDVDVREQLVEMVGRHRMNFYVVGSMNNFGFSVVPGSWRSGEMGSDILSNPNTTVYNGDLTLLRRAHSVREKLIVLETRLDADDGLHREYLDMIQRSALQTMIGGDKPLANQTFNSATGKGDGDGGGMSDGDGTRASWMFWCASRSIEWFPTSLYNRTESNSTNNSSLSSSSDYVHAHYHGRAWEKRQKKDQEFKEAVESGNLGTSKVNEEGTLILRSDVNQRGQDMCVTPGLTVGYGVLPRPKANKKIPFKIPTVPHQDLIFQLQLRKHADHNCGLLDRRKCLTVVNELLLPVIRSRTFTSAGMKDVSFDVLDLHSDRERAMKQWTVLRKRFGIHRDLAVDVNSLLSKDLANITMDNLIGQCTKGHSCKEMSRLRLEEALLAMGVDLPDMVTRKELRKQNKVASFFGDKTRDHKKIEGFDWGDKVRVSLK